MPEESNRRQFGRRKQELLACNLGEVLDISRGGIRILCRRPIEGAQRVELRSLHGELALPARVVWVTRRGRGRHEIGLAFDEADDATASRLTRISSAHVPTPSIRDSA
jgi:hypothetical protein